MMQPETIAAIYKNGVLVPQHPLSLREQQVVMIRVMPEDSTSPDPDRVRWMHRQADAWLAEQPAHAVRQPKPIAAKQKAKEDADFEQLLSELQQQTAFDDEAAVAALVDEALAAVRKDVG
jgi:predicted DNA-binding antitoxin AbrB/MazE fold protein